MHLIGEHLTIERGGRLIVRDLSFRVASGRALRLTGANGAGKTTLLRAIGGFLPLASGVLRLEGGFDDVPVGEHCHVVGHSNAVRGQMTVEENIAFWAGYLADSAPSPAAIDAKVSAALRAFDLAPLARYRVAELSAGQRRRTGLARLVAAARPLWLLDEPTASLDTASAALLVEAVNSHLGDGGLAVIATHLPLDLTAADDLHLVAPVGGADVAYAGLA